MLIDLKLEHLSGHAQEGKVGKIHKNPGDVIEENDILMEIESNKGNVAVKSTAAGQIQSMKVEEGADVKIGDVLATVEGEQQEKDEPSEQDSMHDQSGTKQANSFNYFAGMIKPQKKDLESDITIIGGGPGGYVAAIQAAKLGAKVVLVEKEDVGGTCLNWGCIPTKALVRSAEVYKSFQEAHKYGLQADHFSVDMKKVIERKNNIVRQLIQGVEYLLDKNNVTLIKGLGEIIDKNTVFVKAGNVEATIKTDHIIIATGSNACKLPIPGLESENVLTSREILDMKELPDRMVIIGGGVIGMEFAFIFSGFGVKVSVIEFLDSVLATFDEEVGAEISQAAKDAGIELFTGSKVTEILESENGQPIVSFEKEGKKKYIPADKVLVAIGRVPCLDGTDFEKLGIALNDHGRGINVNEKMQTNIPNIYAIGDVTNKLQLAHVASHQGIIAVKNIMGFDTEMDYGAIPSAVFTDPELATVGLCERGAKEQGIDVEIGKFPFAASGKALALGEPRGFVKIIKEKSSGKVIGGTIIGPHATDLIAEVTLAVQNGLTPAQLIETIHAHPTTAEAVHEAALSLEGGAIHFVE